MRKSLSLNSIWRDSVSSVSSLVALRLRLGIVQQRQRRDPGPVADVEQRDLLLALGAIALLDHRRRRRLDLDRRTLGAQPGVDLARPPRAPRGNARACFHSLRLLAAAAEQLPAAPARHACPMRSITASQDRPVARVTEISNRPSRNRLPPSRPNTRIQRIARPAARGCRRCLRKSRWITGRRASSASPQLATRNPTMPTSRSAGPRSTSPSPSRIHAEQRDPGDDAQHRTAAGRRHSRSSRAARRPARRRRDRPSCGAAR